MLKMAACIDCKTPCHDGELIDGQRCFVCYIRHKEQCEHAATVQALPWATPAQAGRFTALRNIYNPSKGGW